MLSAVPFGLGLIVVAGGGTRGLFEADVGPLGGLGGPPSSAIEARAMEVSVGPRFPTAAPALVALGVSCGGAGGWPPALFPNAASRRDPSIGRGASDFAADEAVAVVATEPNIGVAPAFARLLCKLRKVPAIGASPERHAVGLGNALLMHSCDVLAAWNRKRSTCEK